MSEERTPQTTPAAERDEVSSTGLQANVGSQPNSNGGNSAQQGADSIAQEGETLTDTTSASRASEIDAEDENEGTDTGFIGSASTTDTDDGNA